MKCRYIRNQLFPIFKISLIIGTNIVVHYTAQDNKTFNLVFYFRFRFGGLTCLSKNSSFNR